MIGRLDRYVARTYLSSWFVSLVFFVGLFGVFDFFAKLEDFVEAAENTGNLVALVARFYGYSAPAIFLQVAPFVMLMAAVFTVTRLRRHNELLAMILVGRSTKRVLMPVFAMTVLMVAGLVWVQEWLSPRLAVERDRYRTILLENRDKWVVPSVEIKDYEGKLLVFGDFDQDTGDAARLTVSFLDADGNNHSIQGTGASWQPESGGATGGWRLEDGRHVVHDLTEQTSVEPVYFVPTDVGPDDLRISERLPFDLALDEVLLLSERYPLNRGYRLLRHYHFTFPISIVLLVLLGVPFLLRGESRSTWIGLGLSFGLCMAFMILDTAVRDLGTRGLVAPALAAWFPVVVAGSLGAILVDSLDS